MSNQKSDPDTWIQEFLEGLIATDEEEKDQRIFHPNIEMILILKVASITGNCSNSLRNLPHCYLIVKNI